ncbi:MAG: alpha/beta hydrolase [Deltaproteobacteria bacterium]|nr:alpha/beta hydrolase [Deltaproteobacteria bacterium]
MTALDRVSGCATLPRGGALAFEIDGCAHGGTPLLLIRPLGGSMALWGRFRARLAEERQVIAFDLRGSGHSSPDPAWVTTAGLAKDSLHLLDHLDVMRVDVFGISLGAMAATWLAILAPGRVGKLCLASAPARGLALTRGGLRRELALAACFARRADDVEVAVVDRILSSGFRTEHPDEVRDIERRVRAAPATRTALLKHALAGVLHDARRELAQIDAPTLVLAGERDALLGTAAPRALAAAIPRATFEVVSGAGHDLTLEQPIATATRVAGFLDAAYGSAQPLGNAAASAR